MTALKFRKVAKRMYAADTNAATFEIIGLYPLPYQRKGWALRIHMPESETIYRWFLTMRDAKTYANSLRSAPGQLLATIESEGAKPPVCNAG